MADVEPDTRPFATEPCRSCDAPIIWAVTARTLKPMPVDAVPVKGGNVALELRPDQQPLATVLPVAKQFGRRHLRQSHFASCPQAPQWRGRGRGRS